MCTDPCKYFISSKIQIKITYFIRKFLWQDQTHFAKAIRVELFSFLNKTDTTWSELSPANSELTLQINATHITQAFTCDWITQEPSISSNLKPSRQIQKFWNLKKQCKLLVSCYVQPNLCFIFIFCSSFRVWVWIIRTIVNVQVL